MSMWRPIDTVPQDGREIDIWCLNIADGIGARFPAMWKNDDGKWEDWHGYILEPKWRPMYWMLAPLPPS